SAAPADPAATQATRTLDARRNRRMGTPPFCPHTRLANGSMRLQSRLWHLRNAGKKLPAPAPGRQTVKRGKSDESKEIGASIWRAAVRYNKGMRLPWTASSRVSQR